MLQYQHGIQRQVKGIKNRKGLFPARYRQFFMYDQNVRFSLGKGKQRTEHKSTDSHFRVFRRKRRLSCRQGKLKFSGLKFESA